MFPLCVGLPPAQDFVVVNPYKMSLDTSAILSSAELFNVSHQEEVCDRSAAQVLM